MTDLTLRTHTARHSAIVSAVLSRDDHRAFVFGADTTNDPKRVQHWGWLRRIAQGYSEPALVRPAVGTTFYVREWRYGPSRRLLSSGDPSRDVHGLTVEKFDPIIIARLSDGRTFADQWASSTVLFDALSRWRNAHGHLVDWELSPGIQVETCAIGGLDWAAIPAALAERSRRIARERALADERIAS